MATADTAYAGRYARNRFILPSGTQNEPKRYHVSRHEISTNYLWRSEPLPFCHNMLTRYSSSRQERCGLPEEISRYGIQNDAISRCYSTACIHTGLEESLTHYLVLAVAARSQYSCDAGNDSRLSDWNIVVKAESNTTKGAHNRQYRRDKLYLPVSKCDWVVYKQLWDSWSNWNFSGKVSKYHILWKIWGSVINVTVYGSRKQNTINVWSLLSVGISGALSKLVFVFEIGVKKGHDIPRWAG